jgi:hypothetical protein
MVNEKVAMQEFFRLMFCLALNGEDSELAKTKTIGTT